MPPRANYVFGPVNSRRLGKSLGIDLLPFKTCSLDCIYCECGWTTDQTLRRDEYVPTAKVLSELDAFLAPGPELDYLTFSGSGEPTLHTGIGEIIRHLQRNYPQYKLAVLTNGTILGDPKVQADLATADLVIPSLDSATERGFEKICKPVSGLSAQSVIDALISFRKCHSGPMLLEVFIVPGINDTEDELAALKHAATLIGPDAIQLNTLDRPAPHPGLRIIAITTEKLDALRRFFHPLQVQSIRQRKRDEAAPWTNTTLFQEILAAIRTHPLTLHRLSVAIGIREGDLAKTVAQMAHQKLLRFEENLVALNQASSPLSSANRSATDSPLDS